MWRAWGRPAALCRAAEAGVHQPRQDRAGPRRHALGHATLGLRTVRPIFRVRDRLGGIARNRVVRTFLHRTHRLADPDVGGVCWLNPPYRNLKVWMQKACDSAKANSATVVCLIPAFCNAPWFQTICL